MNENTLWQEYGAAFGFLAHIINDPPSKDTVDNLKKLFSESTNSTDGAYKSIAGYFEAKKDVATDILLQELAVEWTRLFRGVSKGYGPPPPYEGVYRSNDGLGIKIIQEVEQEYRKYGLIVAEEQRNRADYLGYELDFMRFLCDQAAHAAENDLKEEEESYRTDFDHFITEHLSSWVGDFCTQAVEHARTSFYPAVLMLLNDTISDVAAEVNSNTK